MSRSYHSSISEPFSSVDCPDKRKRNMKLSFEQGLRSYESNEHKTPPRIQGDDPMARKLQQWRLEKEKKLVSPISTQKIKPSFSQQRSFEHSLRSYQKPQKQFLSAQNSCKLKSQALLSHQLEDNIESLYLQFMAGTIKDKSKIKMELDNLLKQGGFQLKEGILVGNGSEKVKVNQQLWFLLLMGTELDNTSKINAIQFLKDGKVMQEQHLAYVEKEILKESNNNHNNSILSQQCDDSNQIESLNESNLEDKMILEMVYEESPKNSVILIDQLSEVNQMNEELLEEEEEQEIEETNNCEKVITDTDNSHLNDNQNFQETKDVQTNNIEQEKLSTPIKNKEIKQDHEREDATLEVNNILSPLQKNEQFQEKGSEVQEFQEQKQEVEEFQEQEINESYQDQERGQVQQIRDTQYTSIEKVAISSEQKEQIKLESRSIDMIDAIQIEEPVLNEFNMLRLLEKPKFNEWEDDDEFLPISRKLNYQQDDEQTQTLSQSANCHPSPNEDYLHPSSCDSRDILSSQEQFEEQQIKQQEEEVEEVGGEVEQQSQEQEQQNNLEQEDEKQSQIVSESHIEEEVEQEKQPQTVSIEQNVAYDKVLEYYVSPIKQNITSENQKNDIHQEVIQFNEITIESSPVKKEKKKRIRRKSYLGLLAQEIDNVEWILLSGSSYELFGNFGSSQHKIMRKSRRFFDLKETLCFVRKSIRICNKKLAEKEKKKYTTKVSKIKKGKKKIRKTLKLYSRYKKNN